MGIFLRQSHNVKPSRWGSFADVQYAIRVNSEKIYDCDPDDDVLVMPLFWGFPCLDYSGYNNHGTNHGAIFKDGSLDFDGSDYVALGDVLDFSGAGKSFAITAWIYPTLLTGNDKTIIAKWSVPAQWMLKLDTDGGDESVLFAISDGGGTRLAESAQNTIMLNQWNFVSGIADSGIMSVYVNGQQSGTTGTYGTIDVCSLDVKIGARTSTFGFLDGLIDEVRISKATRSADQIALFNDNKYGLYQKVGRPIWSIPAVGVTIPIFMQNMRGSFNSPGTRGGFIN